ncbi:hypothetical protein QYF36_024486 [Acer negundo]|nr:hypothetical protein QYF36_024486 [Acer negundo]
MQQFTAKIVDMMKQEKLYASQGGPIILSQIENEYGNNDSAYGPAAKTYINWAATMALSLFTGVPCASKQILLIPLSTPAVGSIVTISPQILIRIICGQRIGVDGKMSNLVDPNDFGCLKMLLPSVKAPLYVPPERNMHPAPAYVMNNPAMESTVYTHNQPHILVDEFPERPGQPECSYFLKTGDCLTVPASCTIVQILERTWTRLVQIAQPMKLILVRPTDEARTLGGVVESTIAWPKSCIRLL